MANKIALGLVIGGAVSSTVGAAFKDVESRIQKLSATGTRAKVLQNTIGETIRLRKEWQKAYDTGSASATGLLAKLENNLTSLKKQGVQISQLNKEYQKLGQTARGIDLQVKGHQQIDEGRKGLKSSLGQAAGGVALMAIPTKVSAEFGAIVRDISIKAGIANTPQETQMSRTIIQTSKDSGMARNEVAEVVNAPGMDLSKALEYAPTAAKFVVGQGANGGETAKMINALGQNAKISDPAVMQKALEAIAYQGQAGSFEAADMARWFPELLSSMGNLKITGMDAVTQLGSMLQVQMKTAGGADEAANNLKNWMGKIGSSETVEAYKKVGIDYQASMQTGLQNKKSTLESSFDLAQRYISATDPKKAKLMADATAKISKETDPEKAKQMITALEEALRTGDLFADMQVKAALTAYMQNKDLYDKLKKDSASATGILDKNLAERRDTSSQKWAEMAQGMDEAMRAIGDAMRPVTDAVADGLAYVARGISSVSDKAPGLVMGLAAAGAAVVAFQTVVSSVKIAKGLLNIGRGTLMGNPNIPQRVIVTNMPAGGSGGLEGGMDAGGKSGKVGKGGKGARVSSQALSAKNAVKGAAVFAVIDAGIKAKDTYDNATTRDEKAEGYGEAAGGLAGTLAGAAAGAAIGSAVPVIGTIVGGMIGAYLGNMGGDALGGYLGKSMFGGDEPSKALPVAGPLMMRDAGKDIPPVLGDIAQSFKNPSKAGTPAPLMMALPSAVAPPAGNAVAAPRIAAPAVVVQAPVATSPPGVPALPKGMLPADAQAQLQKSLARLPTPPGMPKLPAPAFDPAKAMLPEAEHRPGDVVRSMALPPEPRPAPGAGPVLTAPVKPQAPKIEQRVQIHAPLQVTVQGDVKDPAQLARELQPYIEQQQRAIAQQLASRQLYDEPHA